MVFVSLKGNRTGATSGAGTAYPSGSPQSLVLCVVFCRSLFVLLGFFLLTIVVSVFRRVTAFE